MRLFRSRSRPPEHDGLHPGLPALLDGSAAVVQGERLTGAAAALPGAGAAARATRLWREQGAQ